VIGSLQFLAGSSGICNAADNFNAYKTIQSNNFSSIKIN
jgi:hypothetical protein